MTEVLPMILMLMTLQPQLIKSKIVATIERLSVTCMTVTQIWSYQVKGGGHD